MKIRLVILRIVALLVSIPPLRWLPNLIMATTEGKLNVFQGSFTYLVNLGIVSSDQFERVLKEYNAEITNGTSPREPQDVAIFIMKRGNVRPDGREPSDREIKEMLISAGVLSTAE